MPNSFNFFVFFLSLISLVACGGGGAGPGAGSSNGNLVDLANSASDPNSLPQGSDSLNLVETWNQWVTLGYRRDGHLRIYWTKDWGVIPLSSERVSIDPDNGRTNLRITHPQHGAKTGDRVTLSNLSKTLHGGEKTWFETSHRITVLDEDHYLLTIPNVLPTGGQTSFTAKALVKYLECVGTQQLQQGPARTENPTITFRGQEASRALSIATTQLQSCSPAESSFTTHKYFDPYDFGLKAFLGQAIEGGLYTAVDSFSLPNSAVQSGDKGTISTATNYLDRTRRQVDSTTRTSYEIQRHTAQSVFLELKSETLENNGFLRSTTRDLYGKVPSSSGSDYSLLRSTVSYNNARKTEVVIDYTANLTQLEPSYQSGSGTLNGVPFGTQQWRFFAIDVEPFKFGGSIEVEITLGSGTSGASYDLFDTSTPSLTAEGRPLGSLANAYDVSPGSKTTLTYNFSNSRIKTYFLGVEGNWGSPSSATNTYSFEVWVRE